MNDTTNFLMDRKVPHIRRFLYVSAIRKGGRTMTPNENGSHVTINDIMKAMEDPLIKKSKPEQLVPNIMNMFGLDLEAVDSTECDAIRQVYFQAFVLYKDRWTEMPGSNNTVQIAPYKLKEVPAGTRLVVDVFIDKSDYESEVFEKYITNMVARGKSLIFYAVGPLPVDLTLGLKCVDALTGEPFYIPDDLLQKA